MHGDGAGHGAVCCSEEPNGKGLGVVVTSKNELPGLLGALGGDDVIEGDVVKVWPQGRLGPGVCHNLPAETLMEEKSDKISYELISQ